MARLSGGLARGGVAASVFLLLLTLSRLGPVHAEPPGALALLTGRALPLFAAAVVFAVLAALGGATARGPGRAVRAWLVTGAVAALGLGITLALRPAAGLRAAVAEGDAAVGALPEGPLDLVGRDLQELPRLRRPRLSWAGELRAPATGTYVLQAEGRGRLEVRLDGWPALRGDGDPLRATARVPIVKGAHRLEVQLERDAPGARLRLSWALPGSERPVLLPPRALGARIPAAWWWATDLFALALAASVAALLLVTPWNARRDLPPPRRVTWTEGALLAAGLGIVLVAMSWPLVTDPARLGVTDRPDGRLNAWILAWDAHALGHDPGRLWDAPAFHPLRDALAFSENLLGLAVLVAPFQVLGGPVLAYNVALLLSLFVSGLGAAALVRRVTGDPVAAFVAGALFAAGSHRFIRLAHLHAQATLFLPFVLLALDRFVEDRRWRSAVLVGLLLALQGYSSVYLGAITALALAAAILVAVVAGLPREDLLKLGAGLLLAGALLWPVARPYLRMREQLGQEFGLHEVARYATTLESYAASGTRLYGPLTQRHLDPERVQDTLFPGLVPLALGLAGLAAAPRRYRAVAVFASLAAVLFSLGPATPLYRFLHEHVVLVRAVRALSRFSLVPVLFLCVLTGLFLAGRRRAVAALALALALLEANQAPLAYARYEGPSPAARFLRGGEGAVAVLPLGDDDTAAMLDGVAHWRPLVNGDSGFVPRPYTRVLELLSGPLDAEGVRLLRALGVAHVVSARDEPQLAPSARFGAQQVFTLPPGEAARVVEAGAPVATAWTDRATLDLGAPRVVGRVVFEPSDAPWVSEPQLAVSLDGAVYSPLVARASLADATYSLLREPRLGRGEIVFPKTRARFLRLGPRVPARRGLLEVGE